MGRLLWGRDELRWGLDKFLWGGSGVPTVVITTPDQLVDGGQTITLTAMADDPGGSITRIEWTGAGTFGAPDALTTAWTAPPESAGAVPLTLRIEVFDNDGNAAADTVTITVRGAAVVAPPGAGQGVSVFDPRIRSGWRDPELPIATPGIVATFTTTARLSGSTITIINDNDRVVGRACRRTTSLTRPRASTCASWSFAATASTSRSGGRRPTRIRRASRSTPRPWPTSA